MTNIEKIYDQMVNEGVVTRDWAKEKRIPWDSVRRDIYRLFYKKYVVNFPGQEYRLAA